MLKNMKWKKINFTYLFTHHAHHVEFKNRTVKVANHQYLLCRAGVPDAAELLFVEKRAFAGRTPWKLKTFLKEISRKRRTLFIVMRHEDQAVGYIAARFKRNNSAVHITNLAILPEFRRQKLAYTLLATLLKTASNLGGKKAVLEVGSDNFAAQALYSVFGFEKVQIAKNYYPEIQQDGWRMMTTLPLEVPYGGKKA